jgi:cytochrome c oxidase accessory protein FixG
LKREDKRELHETRLATTDEKGNRVYLFPEDIKGFWRKRRSIFYFLLIAIYLVVPWTKVGGIQTILIDIPERHFVFFGNEFFGHDGIYLFFFIAGWLFFFGVLTSIGGRIWCGWACPQTVFIDRIYRKIEIWIEGSAHRRKKLNSGPWNSEKIGKKSLKWALFVIVSLMISHSFLAYFVGSYKFIEVIQHGPQAHFTLFVAMLIVTFIVLFDFGWFREQFCIIACPYGRIQSVIMDSQSMVVAYDEKRGEPRKGTENRSEFGDCVNCFQCVAVCPTGIDIRRGTQLECIACTACIDACDNIMERLKKPKGLIRYASEDELEGKKTSTFSIRRLVYFGVFVGLISAGLYFVGESRKLHAIFMRSGNNAYRISGEDKQTIVNHYRVDLRYKQDENLNIRFEGPAGLDGLTIVSPQSPIALETSRNKIVNLFFKFPRYGLLVDGRKDIIVKIINEDNRVLLEKEIPLVGPFN